MRSWLISFLHYILMKEAFLDFDFDLYVIKGGVYLFDLLKNYLITCLFNHDLFFN